MNERIKFLAKRSGWVDTDCADHSTFFNFDIEEFAEQIVNECIEYCGENLSAEPKNPVSSGRGSSPTTMAGALKINLGIE